MKSDSFIKMIAGVVVVTLFVNSCFNVVFAHSDLSLISSRALGGFAVALESAEDFESVYAYYQATKDDDAKVEGKESDVSREQNQDNIDGQKNLTNEDKTEGTSNNETTVEAEDKKLSAETDEKQVAALEEEATNAEEIKDTEKNIETSKYANIGVCTASDYANIRKGPGTDTDVVGKLYRGSTVTIVSEADGWYSIVSGSVKGYIWSEVVKTGLSDEELVKSYGKESMTVKPTTLNVRTEKSKTAGILKQIAKGESYAIVSKDDQWVKISIANTYGYVARDYVDIAVKFNEAVSIEEELERQREEAEKAAKAKAEAEAKKEAERKAKEAASKKSESSSKSSGKSSSGTKSSSTSSSSVSTSSADMSSYDKNVMYIACMIYKEAGSESYEGKVAVGNVIINRKNSSKYPNTIYGVISQSGQFSPYRTGSFQAEVEKYKAGKYRSDSTRKKCVEAAKAALNGENYVGNRTSFNGKNSTNMSYSNSMVIGNHAFW